MARGEYCNNILGWTCVYFINYGDTKNVNIA